MLKSRLNHLFCTPAYGAADFDKSCLLLKTLRHCNIFCAMWLMFPYLHRKYNVFDGTMTHFKPTNIACDAAVPLGEGLRA